MPETYAKLEQELRQFVATCEIRESGGSDYGDANIAQTVASKASSSILLQAKDGQKQVVLSPNAWDQLRDGHFSGEEVFVSLQPAESDLDG